MKNLRALTPRQTELLLAIGLLLLAALGMSGVLQNAWVQDDTGIIERNALVHSLSGIWRAFAHPYWPTGERAELYRPLLIAFYTVQWAVGGGAIWVFRVVNLLAYGAAVLAVWGLLRRLVPAPAAWVGAAIFAVHPVHVEAVAVSVNQGETLVAALICFAAMRYLDWRRGELPARRAQAEILLSFLAGLFIKEHTLILPGILFAFEVTLLQDGAPWRARVRQVGPLYAALAVTGVLFWILRGAVIGPGAGTAPAEVLAGLSFGHRALTMLGVVPEWIRLLLWPAHLQSEWSPLEYTTYVAWSLRETVGLVGLGSLLLALGVAWGRSPRVTLALLWLAVALFPVSSLVVPIGVVIAERTLFLPSVSVTILVAVLAARAEEIPALVKGPLRTGIVALLGLVLGVGTIACATRMITWRNRVLFLASAVHDAPRSYRPYLALGVVLHELGDSEGGDSNLRTSVALHRQDMSPFVRIAWNLQHHDADCRPAVTLYHEILNNMPRRGDMRSGYVACATWLGRYDEAAAGARDGVRIGIDARYWTDALAVIRKAATAHAPAKSVLLPRLPGGWTDIGPHDSTAGLHLPPP